MKKSKLQIAEAIESLDPSVLSTEDLLTVILNNPAKASRMLAVDVTLFDNHDGGLSNLHSKSYAELKYFGGLSDNECSRLTAAIELGKRIAFADCHEKRFKISSPQDAAKFLTPLLAYANQELCYVLLLNTKNFVIKAEKVSEGGMNSSVVDPRIIFSKAIVNRASAIILGHSHPSGLSEVSAQDDNITQVIKSGAETLGLSFLDHIVIPNGNGKKFYSYREHGRL